MNNRLAAESENATKTTGNPQQNLEVCPRSARPRPPAHPSVHQPVGHAFLPACLDLLVCRSVRKHGGGPGNFNLPTGEMGP